MKNLIDFLDNSGDVVIRKRRLRLIIPAFSAFNIYSMTAKKTTALGPVYIGTIIRNNTNWLVEIIDENNFRKLSLKDSLGRPDHNLINKLAPADAVGLYGGLTSTIPRLYELAEFYSDQKAVVFAGGQHFSPENVSDALNHFIDFIVVGEGELTALELIQALDNGTEFKAISGLAFMERDQVVFTTERTPITDFTFLPLPDFSLLKFSRIKLYPVSWVRGCGMNCEFCTVKGAPRAPCTAHAFEQFRTLAEHYGAKEFFLVDDLFGQRRTETLELCALLADYQVQTGISFTITVQIRWDKGRDTELLKAMRLCNIRNVCIGFESPIPSELEAMNKHVNSEDMVRMTHLFHQAGFHIHGMFIFGYPLKIKPENPVPLAERIRAYRHFIKVAKLDTIQVLLPIPLPGTDLTARLALEHLILPREIVGWEFYDGNFPLIIPDAPNSCKDMHDAIQKIMGRFYGFRQTFRVLWNITCFPTMLFTPFHIKQAWRLRCRILCNSCLRVAGWLVLKRWLREFRRGVFTRGLNRAEHLDQQEDKDVKK